MLPTDVSIGAVVVDSTGTLVGVSLATVIAGLDVLPVVRLHLVAQTTMINIMSMPNRMRKIFLILRAFSLCSRWIRRRSLRFSSNSLLDTANLIHLKKIILMLLYTKENQNSIFSDNFFAI